MLHQEFQKCILELKNTQQDMYAKKSLGCLECKLQNVEKKSLECPLNVLRLKIEINSPYTPSCRFASISFTAFFWSCLLLSFIIHCFIQTTFLVVP
jgi:hypothetical protein